MMESVCKILLLLLVIGFSQPLSAKEFKRDTMLQFDIAQNGVVNLSNKYGKVDVHTWASNKVKIEVIITVNARNQNDANDIFETIDVEFSQQGNYVNANTIIQAKKNHLDYSIDYEVYMPKSCSLKIQNWYGNSRIAGLGGDATANVKYGNIRFKTVEKDLDIDLKYGNCTVDKASNTVIKLEHGFIDLKEAKDVNLVTRYSKVNLDKANEITCDTRNDIYKVGVVNTFHNYGRYDNLDIQEVQHLVVESEYSDLFIGKLVVNADIKMKYGGVNLDHVLAGFHEIVLEGSETDFKIRVGEDAAYRIELTGRYCAIRVPKLAKLIQDERKESQEKIKGYIGYDMNAPRVIKANMKNGSFKLR